jgi:hypothetical protein
VRNATRASALDRTKQRKPLFRRDLFVLYLHSTRAHTKSIRAQTFEDHMAKTAVAKNGNSWAIKLAKPRNTKRVLINAPFAGIPAGSMLFVGTPDIVASYVKKIPRGETRTIERMRREIARNNDCDAMCPVSTAIFLRMVAEGAWDELQAGKAPDKVVPFWRAIEAGSAIAKKLRADSAWLTHQRAIETSSPMKAKEKQHA